MKQFWGVVSILVLIGAIVFVAHEVKAQSKESSSEGDLKKVLDRLDKIDTQLQLISENQDKMFVELRRGRYFTTHRA
ncbi:MAG: hypothetical protein HZC17_00450 [Candidatus Omnitrophica bacterium]|nr:hypothetical protein [Candidatus Omnitrophota bacterium]